MKTITKIANKISCAFAAVQTEYRLPLMNYQFAVKQLIMSTSRFVQMANRISSGFPAKASLGEMSSFDLNTGVQIEMKLAVKRKRETSDGSENRERKMSRSDHRSASDCSKDSLISGFSSPAILRDPDLSSGSQAEMRLGNKRKNERSDSAEWKRRRSDLQSDSSIDSLTSAFSCMYSSTPPAACGETPMKESSKAKQFGLSHLNNSEVKPVPGKDKEQSGLSHLNNSEVTSGVSAVKSSRNYKEQPELSHPNNSDVRPGRSLMKRHIIDDKQPGTSHPVKLDQGVKRKRENYGRAVSSERKKTKLDPDSYPPGSHGDASSAGPSVGSQTEKQGGKRKGKTSCRRSRSEHRFETLIDSLSSEFAHMYISSPLLACVKMLR